MKYDVEKAFCFIKNDKQWLKKLLIPSVIVITTILLMIISVIFMLVTKDFKSIWSFFFILSAFFYLFSSLGIYGFTLQYGHDRIYNENAPLPDWENLGSFLFIAIKASLGSLLYYLPLILFSIAATMLEIAAKSSPDSLSLTSSIVNIVYNLVYILYFLMFFVFNASFLKDFNLFSFLNAAKAYRMLKTTWMQYFVVVLLLLAMGALLNLAGIFMILTIIGVLAIPFALIYIQIVTMDLIAQYVRIEEDSKKTASEQ